jgi:hypothetical protein
MHFLTNFNIITTTLLLYINEINIFVSLTQRDVSPIQYYYRGADKFLARPERNQATGTEDFYVHISYL